MTRTFQVGTGDLLQTQQQAPAGDGPFDLFRVHCQLTADRGANEVATVRIKPFLHKQVDLAEIYQAKIDRDFLGVRRFCHCLWSAIIRAAAAATSDTCKRGPTLA